MEDQNTAMNVKTELQTMLMIQSGTLSRCTEVEKQGFKGRSLEIPLNGSR